MHPPLTACHGAALRQYKYLGLHGVPMWRAVADHKDNNQRASPGIFPNTGVILQQLIGIDALTIFVRLSIMGFYYANTTLILDKGKVSKNRL